jgi:hypothetical protein
VRVLRFLARLVGWLLTPLVALAASFFGAWLGLLVTTPIGGSTLAVGVAVLLGAAAAIGTTIFWMRILRRSPELQEALAVTEEGVPVAAVEAVKVLDHALETLEEKVEATIHPHSKESE